MAFGAQACSESEVEILSWTIASANCLLMPYIMLKINVKYILMDVINKYISRIIVFSCCHFALFVSLFARLPLVLLCHAYLN